MKKQSLLSRIAKKSGTIYALHEYRKNAIRKPFVSTQIPKNGIGAELGVHKGFFTRTLLQYATPTKLHLIDPWYKLSSEWTWTGGNRCTVEGLIGVYRSYKREVKSGQVIVHVDGDLEVLAGFPDAYLDWVYVDSSHEYQHTCQELALLHHKVKPTGVIAGDDWQSNPNHGHHGVCRAVREFIESAGYELVYSSDEDKQWAIRRKA
jgi:hypothetical protein